MNRAQRRMFAHRISATTAPPERVAVLEITEKHRDVHMPHIADGEVITIRGYRLVAGKLEKCAPGQETPMRIEVRTATAKPKELASEGT